ncbi:Flp family type IVb pilin [Marinobacterium sediminicola]|uniref:Pilus assembly protein Flp/PilA n=1 Tax=Marinobacterium sediminicola TaxID=518898 RepID=A0ABY1RZP9_9GAMM|nr:pilus assembly protein [Marinobacterium sediminicola]ULG69957.1 pilus assembly protein [Marinobacterium sediminicola]SMR74407.1 pilus assembly protein Flp/PilA [Marinobacterium sediminicola]
MNVITQKFVDFIKEEEGLTTVEYAVAGALIAAVVVLAFTELGLEVCNAIVGLVDAINGDAAPTTVCGA